VAGAKKCREAKVIREEKQQQECDPREREKYNQQKTGHEVLLGQRTLFLHLTQRICRQSNEMPPGSRPKPADYLSYIAAHN